MGGTAFAKLARDAGLVGRGGHGGGRIRTGDIDVIFKGEYQSLKN
jgi:hypothetical protein